MKHNIAFLLPLFFFPSHRTASHNTCTRGGERINIIQRALQSQTPCNLSALDFKVWVFAYFVLDCCHFVILVPFFSPPPAVHINHWRKDLKAVVYHSRHRMKAHTGQKKVHLRSRPVIHLITVSVSGSFEQPSVANLPLITLANYQPQTPRQKKKENSTSLNFSPSCDKHLQANYTNYKKKAESTPFTILNAHL